MLRLQNRLISAVRAAWPLPAAASLHGHHPLPLSTAAASRAPFVAEEYLVTTCGLTPAQALKSSKYLAHVTSPAKADAVLAFLADAGLAKADVAAAIARHPLLLCSKVDKTLAPRIGMLRDMGLSPAQISSLISVAPDSFRSRYMIPGLGFLLSFMGSYEKVHPALKRSRYLLKRDIERVVKTSVAFLQQCGLTHCDIAVIFRTRPMVLASEPERLKEAVVCADKLGVPRDSGMFKYAIMCIHHLGPETIGARSDLLKKAIGCSEAQLATAVRKFPDILRSSEDKLRRVVKFLKMEVGLKSEYIVHRPALLAYSMKMRLIPRYYVLKVLQEKGLLKKDTDFFNLCCLTEKRFAKKILDPYKEVVPGLAAAYAELLSKSNDDRLK